MNEMPVNNTPAYQEYHPEIIKKYSFSSREIIFSYISVILGFLSVKLFAAPLFTYGRMGLGAAIFALALTAYCIAFPAKRVKLTFNKALRIALCISFSVNIFISSNLLIQFLDMIFVLLVLAYDRLADSDGQFNSVRKLFPADMFSSVMILPFAEYGSAPAALKAPAEKTDSGKNIKSAILGLIIAIPATLVVGTLLMSADDNFSRILSSIMNDGFAKVMIFIVQLLIGLPVSFYIFSGCRASEKQLSKALLNDEKCESNLRSVRFLSPVAGVFSAVPVCVLYVIFFFSQLSYFLSAFINKLPSDISAYSEYARRGFFQLCFVSVINLAIIIALNLFCKDNDKGCRPTSVKAMTCILSVFTLLLITTAVSKMLMYIRVYGLTPLRVYTSWFMILLFVLFVSIILSVITKKINASKITVTAFVIMFAALSFCNIDGVIARYDLNEYNKGNLPYFSFSLMNDLSSGAAPEIIRYKSSCTNEHEIRILDSILDEMENDCDSRTLTVNDIILSNSLSN